LNNTKKRPDIIKVATQKTKVKHNVYLITALLHLAEADVHELNTNKNIS
jgi:hypothetical protein